MSGLQDSNSYNGSLNFRSNVSGRTKSVGAPTPEDKKQQAEEFVKRLKKDKQEREAQHRMMTQAKDNAFLSKL